MNFHCNESFNAVVNDALIKVRFALEMAEQNRDHARAHDAHGIAKQDEATMARLERALQALVRAVRS